MNDRFYTVSAQSPDDLIDKLNELAKETYFTIVHIWQESAETLGQYITHWRAMIDYAVPAVMPIDLEIEELVHSKAESGSAKMV